VRSDRLLAYHHSLHEGRRMRRTRQRALHEIAIDPVIGRLAACLTHTQRRAIAVDLAERDPFSETKALAAALHLAGDRGGERVVAAIEHQLWCACREAAWRTAPQSFEPLAIHVKDGHFARETEGRAMVLVVPMTVPLCDALCAVRALMPERTLVLYGEGRGAADLGSLAGDLVMAGDGLRAVRVIDAVLKAGGVLCTYSDFVYDGHAALPVRIFGLERPLSSAFVALAVRHETRLLPVVLVRQADQLHVCAEEPTRLDRGGEVLSAEDSAAAHHAAARAVAEMLEAKHRRGADAMAVAVNDDV
jgi:hypothetical protein